MNVPAHLVPGQENPLPVTRTYSVVIAFPESRQDSRLVRVIEALAGRSGELGEGGNLGGMFPLVAVVHIDQEVVERVRVAVPRNSARPGQLRWFHRRELL